MSALAAIALGSNLQSRFGDREANLREAIRRIETLGDVRAVSSFYDTEPVGYLDQPRFLNAALLLETAMGPVELMRQLLKVERAMGRERPANPWAPGAALATKTLATDAILKGPRVIDLDL